MAPSSDFATADAYHFLYFTSLRPFRGMEVSASQLALRREALWHISETTMSSVLGMRPARSSGPIAGTQALSLSRSLSRLVMSRLARCHREADVAGPGQGSVAFCCSGRGCPVPSHGTEAASRKRAPPGSRAAHRAAEPAGRTATVVAVVGPSSHFQVALFSQIRDCANAQLSFGCLSVISSNDLVVHLRRIACYLIRLTEIIESFVCHYAALGFCKLLPGARHLRAETSCQTWRISRGGCEAA